MKPGQRYALAVALALAVFFCLGLLAIPGRKPVISLPEAVELARPPPEPSPAEKPLLPIEEVLAEEKIEAPGAIYFMSRIREAVREGNPAFGRELLRQLKDDHPNSVLIYEAEELLEKRR
jgi:hypothetical protein